jgi:hypothetical protein
MAPRDSEMPVGLVILILVGTLGGSPTTSKRASGVPRVIARHLDPRAAGVSRHTSRRCLLQGR